MDGGPFWGVIFVYGAFPSSMVATGSWLEAVKAALLAEILWVAQLSGGELKNIPPLVFEWAANWFSARDWLVAIPFMAPDILVAV